MAIQLANNASSIRITDGSIVRDLIKSQIIEIALIKTNIVKIDIGKGALHNVFIPYSQVSSPITGAPHVLINTMIDWLMYDGKATEQRQVAETSSTSTLVSYSIHILNQLQTMSDKTLAEPLIIDTRSVNLTYKGYAYLGTMVDEPYWAIQRIQKVGTIEIIAWVNGAKDFSNVWNDRDSLPYY